jgi:hypothetical protein
MEVADIASIVVVSAAEVDAGGGLDVATRRALAGAIDAVTWPATCALWTDSTSRGLEGPPEAVKVRGWKVGCDRVCVRCGGTEPDDVPERGA